MLPDDVKEQVRQATDIVDLVGQYLPLRRQGRNYVAHCPWHDDRRPSLQVNAERQSWKCWVCDVGGDVFSFVMKIENLDFREALEMLADRGGIALGRRAERAEPGEDREGRPTSSPTDKKTLLAANAWAEAQYHRCLLESPAAAPAREYLADRAIDADSIAQFRLGFAPPGWDWLLKLAAGTEFPLGTFAAAGLLVERAGGDGHYDRFRGRLMFPIRDVRGRPIAFGGRVLPQLARDDDAKYVNSAESVLFAKSRELYGLDLAKDHTGRRGGEPGSVVVVEGYTDCIMAHQQGVQNVVAVLGTALTDRHIPLLRRYADTVYLVLDGDAAGQRRASEVLEIFVANDVDLRILTLPSDADPCDFIVQHGGEAFRQLLGKAVDALEHRIQSVTKGMETAGDTLRIDTHRANVAVEKILDTLARAPHPSHGASSAVVLREQQVLSRLAREFHVPESTLRSRLVELRRGKRRSATPAVTPDESSAAPEAKPVLHPLDRELLELILISDEARHVVLQSVAVEDLCSPPGQAVFEKCLELQAAGEPINFDRLMLATESAAWKNLLVEVDEDARRKEQSDLGRRLRDVLNRIEKHRRTAVARQQIAMLREGKLDGQTEEEVLDQFMQTLQGRRPGSEPTDG